MTNLKNDYVSLQFRSKLATYFIIFSAITHLILIFVNYKTVALIRKAAFVSSYSAKKALRAEVRDLESFLAITFILFVIALVLASIFSLMWLHRAYSNLSSFGVSPKYTPGMAVGYYFIPFVNVVMPFFVYKELWEKSKIEEGQFNREQSPPPALIIGIWWFILGIGANIISIAGTIKYRDAVLLGDIINAVYFDIATYFMSLAFIVILAYIINYINKTQEKTHLSSRLRERREAQAHI